MQESGSGCTMKERDMPECDGIPGDRCSYGQVNVSYGAVIGIPLFDPRVTNPDGRES